MILPPPARKPPYAKIGSAIKKHGGKANLADRIIGLMPPHLHYIEPYFGSGAVLFAKNPEGVSEVINDLDSRMMNFWKTLQDEQAFEFFIRQVEATPFSEKSWEEAHYQNHPLGTVLDAVAFFVDCRQSMSGRQTSFAPVSKNRTRRGMNEQVSAWLTAVEGLRSVRDRLMRVLILNQPAVEVIGSQDAATTLFYLDPPYVKETRTAKSAYGEFEMSTADHDVLLETILDCQGFVMISGYSCELYESKLSGWRREVFNMPNNAATGDTKRRMTEVLWMNY